MKHYHATTMSNYLGILHDKVIRPGYDHIVYMCEKPEDALKFTYIRGLKEIIVLTIDLPDDFLVEETFDHSYEFFQCKSFGTLEPIPSKYIKEARKYEF